MDDVYSPSPLKSDEPQLTASNEGQDDDNYAKYLQYMQDTYGIDLSDDLSLDNDSIQQPVLSASPNTIAYDDDLYNTPHERKSDIKSYTEVTDSENQEYEQ